MARAINRDHDHYVLKNRMLAAAEDVGRREKQGEGAKEAAPREKQKSCFSCKLKKTCTQFRSKRGGGATGVVSFGGNDMAWACDRYELAPDERRGMSTTEIRSLMRNFRRAK